MPIGWYIAPYQRVYRGDGVPRRRCDICQYNKQIWAAGGKWTCTEVLGNRLVCKVKAPQAVLDFLDGEYQRLPKNVLTDSLSNLSTAAKTKIKNEILDMGYTVAEVKAKFGDDLGQYTLKDVLKFMNIRRRRMRYNTDTDEMVCDGVVIGRSRSIEYIDNKVQ